MAALLVDAEADAMLAEMRQKCCCVKLLADYDYVWDVAWCDPDDPTHTDRRHRYSYEELGDAIRAAHAAWQGEH